MKSDTDCALSAQTQALMKKLVMPIGQQVVEKEPEAEEELKIFYCSRTHSQLTQFINEVRRVKLLPSVPPEPTTISNKPDKDLAEVEELVKHITLGSRKTCALTQR